ncbi:crossover junction endodeoxyribonuclease RuvC [Alicyclobacillus herbarius]|uniref:crossover junction endodeoxyribonuclease RuvC n=1 Tax=Alicyclobacillus herbarius TaxID=122960 RepID=UPI00041AA44C|nr:crossover junction endodeoxyribonuclease RuvC [Alicyclobacillus herbarius]
MQRLYLSLDPSQASTGWAIIGVAKRTPRFVAGGFIDTKTANNPLRSIRQEVQRLLQTYPIERSVAKERMFYRNNLATLALAKVHGVIEEVLDGYDVFDIPSSTVRKIVGGHGCASKDLVASGVRRLLGLPRTFVFDRWDISDAASVGITYLYQAGLIDIPA